MNTATDTGTFSTDIAGLDECAAPTIVALADGDVYDLRICSVVKQIGDDRVRMIAYNGSIPGPTLRVQQGASVTVNVRNDADVEATVHWHGLRLDNRYDGVPNETQAPIPVGGEFTYELTFPDEGLYWYHPHIREDYGLEMGLYGNIIVDPADPYYWEPVDREAVVTLDDLLIENGAIAAFQRSGPTHVAMGRFGNVMLTNGQTHLELAAQSNDVVRFYLTNTANSRLFNVGLPGGRMKLVGGDSGRYEHETFVETVLLAPSERAIIDVQYPNAGTFSIEHRTPDDAYVLGGIAVADRARSGFGTDHFDVLRTAPELVDARAALDVHRNRTPDKTLAFESLMPRLYAEEDVTASEWTCPMHSEIRRCEKGTCPICGMKLIPATEPAPVSEDHAHTHTHATSDGLEWEDLMPDINATTDPSNMIWHLVDKSTGKKNWEIDWSFTVGDQVKIRLVNDMAQDHPMHHPFHIHGAGRFLIICRDGVPDPNLIWKDTVLIRSGETIDILLDVSNPGVWMAHCHIAEHNQSGMMFSFPVSSAS